MALYPFRFEPIYKPKVWGGRTLEKLGRTLPGGPDHRIGESWEIADLKATSPGGGGGEAAHSTLANGPLAGQSIDRLIERLGPQLMGSVPLTEEGGFPLLIKLLDARENLSVQVHPDEAYAREHPGAHLKSEAWYVLDAEPDAAIYKGIREGVTPERFRRAVEDGPDSIGVEDLLIRIPVSPGDCHYLPSGTCHALGAGLIVAEVQTPSDTTFRVYDWGRRGRELHVEQALACIRFGPAESERYQPMTRIERAQTIVRALVHCEHFRIEQVNARAGYEAPLVLNDQPRIWITLGGSGLLTCRNGGCDEVAFHRAQTLLLPADMDRPRLRLSEDAAWLEVTFPQATADLLA